MLDRAVAWIRTMAQRVLSAAASGAQRVLGWLGLRRPFRTVDGQSHTLYFERRGGRVQLIRASDLPTEINTYLNALSFPPGPQADALSEAKTVAARIALITRTPASGEVTTSPSQETDIINDVSRLSVLLRTLVALPPVAIEQLPAAQWDRSRAPAGGEQHSNVFFLSSASATGGSAAGGTTPEWDFVVGKEPKWVRMHLIPYSVGGRGVPDNWVPAPENVNTSGAVRNSFEAALERAVRSAAIPAQGTMRPRDARAVQPNVVWVETRVTAYKLPVTDFHGRRLIFPDRLNLKFGLYRPDPAATPPWVRLEAPVSNQNVAIGPLPDDHVIHLSHSSGTAMRASAIPHMSGKRYSNRLVDLIKEMRAAGEFADWKDFRSRLAAAAVTTRDITAAIADEIVDDWEKMPDRINPK